MEIKTTYDICHSGQCPHKRWVAVDDLIELINVEIMEVERKAELGLPERRWGSVYLTRIKTRLEEGNNAKSNNNIGIY